MATTSPEQANLTAHDLLLRLAGRIPDLTLGQARRVLADGTEGQAMTLVADLLGITPIRLTAEEIGVIRDLSGDAGALPGAQPAAQAPALQCGFSEFDPYGQVRRDEIDEALVSAAEGLTTSLTGIWRTWRYLLRDKPEALDDPLRVYIVQVEDPAMIQEVTARLLGALPDPAAAGLEIITLGAEPPAYQRAALARSMLLWSMVEPEFTIARIFDYADPVTGPGFAADHAVISDAVRQEALLTYLRSGYPVLMTAAAADDVLDPAACAVVPTSFRTDGAWIWTDSAGYYLSRYGLAPDAELTAHIEASIARGETVPSVDADTAIRASDFLLHPPAAQARTAVWFPGDNAVRGSH